MRPRRARPGMAGGSFQQGQQVGRLTGAPDTGSRGGEGRRICLAKHLPVLTCQLGALETSSISWAPQVCSHWTLILMPPLGSLADSDPGRQALGSH